MDGYGLACDASQLPRGEAINTRAEGVQTVLDDLHVPDYELVPSLLSWIRRMGSIDLHRTDKGTQ